MLKEFVKEKFFGKMKFVNKLRDKVLICAPTQCWLCSKLLLQQCWQGNDLTKQGTIDAAAKAWWNTVGRKPTFETVTNTQNNVIKKIKYGFLGKFSDFWHCLV